MPIVAVGPKNTLEKLVKAIISHLYSAASSGMMKYKSSLEEMQRISSKYWENHISHATRSCIENYIYKK